MTSSEPVGWVPNSDGSKLTSGALIWRKASPRFERNGSQNIATSDDRRTAETALCGCQPQRVENQKVQPDVSQRTGRYSHWCRGGLGRAHAIFLARQGAKVVVGDLVHEAADRVAAEIAAAGHEAIALAASVTDEDAVAAMVAQTIKRWGRVDILINNAGILRDKSFAKMSLDDFRLVVE
jgi:hypothetical protein